MSEPKQPDVQPRVTHVSDAGDVISACTVRPLKGTALAYVHARAGEF